MALPLRTFLSTSLLVLAAGAVQAQAAAPVCVLDEAVKERFIPVELFVGLPETGKQDLAFPEIDRTFPFVDVLPDGKLSSGDVVLKGPMQWTGEGGKDYQIYERKVPRAHERFALTPDRTAIGRVYDQRFGNAVNEGKFPVGLWQQGQKRSYATSYSGRQATSSLEIEKLSCTYEGTPGAMQYRWKTSSNLDYGYIYAPGKGIVQVFTYRQGR